MKNNHSSKKLAAVLTTFVLLAMIANSSVFLRQSVADTSANLIMNPSLAIADPANANAPQSWQFSSWGTNDATGTYPVAGPGSSTAAAITITSYTSGDARWMSNSIPVVPGTIYGFSDSYNASTASNIVVEYTMTNGSTTFDTTSFPQLAATNGTWTTAEGTFVVPANAVSASVYHLIQSVGQLSVTNYFLTLVPAVPVTDFIPNNSVEIPAPIDPTLPADWSHGGYGVNTPIFEYASDGYDGTRSVKLTVTNYQSGDAKWIPNPQPLSPGDYTFTAWYKTDTVPHVVAEYQMTDGSQTFFGLSNPVPNGTDNWQQYSGVFPVPTSGVKAVTVFFFLSNNGSVQTDDYQITPYTYAGFNRPIVTLTFDNGFESNVTTALPILQKYGFKTTMCYSTEYVEGIPDSIADVQKLTNAGEEPCSHSVNHEDLTLVTSTTALDYQLSHSQQYIESITGQPVTAFITPFGAYNATTIQEIKKYYQTNRNTDEGYNSADNLNPYNILVQNVQTSTTLGEFQGWVNKAIATKTWLMVVYHMVGNTNLEQYDIHTADFAAQMQYLASTGVTVLPWNQALAEVTGEPIPPSPTSTPNPTETPEFRILDVTVTGLANGDLASITTTDSTNGTTVTRTMGDWSAPFIIPTGNPFTIAASADNNTSYTIAFSQGCNGALTSDGSCTVTFTHR